MIAVGIGALFSLFFHIGVDEVKQNQDYFSNANQSKSPSAMKALDWLKEKQFYQVILNNPHHETSLLMKILKWLLNCNVTNGYQSGIHLMHRSLEVI